MMSRHMFANKERSSNKERFANKERSSNKERFANRERFANKEGFSREECFSRKESNMEIYHDSLCTILEEVLRDKQSFWKKIIEEHVSSCYNMVTIHKNYFEDLLANSTPSGDTMIELTTRRTIQDMPIKELLLTIKDIYENSRIVDMVEIDENDMIFYHNYRNQEAVQKLKRIIVTLLENSGHLYDAKSTSNMIILKHKQNVSHSALKSETCQR